MTRKTWEEVRLETSRFTDKLGNPLDAEILDFVTTVRYVGYETVLSCGGHTDRMTGGPYVILISKKGRSILQKDSLDEQNRLLAQRKTATEAQSLQRLLVKFYSYHRLNYDYQIILRMIGYDAFRLSCQGADLLSAETSNAYREERIRKYREEFGEFGKFLLKEKA